MNGPDDVAAQVRELHRLAARLDDVATGLARLPGALAAAWADPAGAEWADRLELVRRETARTADALTADALTTEALTADAFTADAPAAGARTGDDPTGGPVPGIRPGGTGATRTTDRRGVVAPLLPPHPGD